MSNRADRSPPEVFFYPMFLRVLLQSVPGDHMTLLTCDIDTI